MLFIGKPIGRSKMISIYIYINLHVYINMCIYIIVDIYTYIFIYACISLYMCIQVCVFVCLVISLYKCIHWAGYCPRGHGWAGRGSRAGARGGSVWDFVSRFNVYSVDDALCLSYCLSLSLSSVCSLTHSPTYRSFTHPFNLFLTLCGKNPQKWLRK